MGELMTEKGGPMPLMGELRVLMGECSCPGEPSEEPMLGPREGCSEGAAMELRAAGELREEEFTCVEKSARQEATGGRSGAHTGDPLPLGPRRPRQAWNGKRLPCAGPRRRGSPGRAHPELTSGVPATPAQLQGLGWARGRGRKGRLTAYPGREARWLPLEPTAPQGHPPGMPGGPEWPASLPIYSGGQGASLGIIKTLKAGVPTAPTGQLKQSMPSVWMSEPGRDAHGRSHDPVSQEGLKPCVLPAARRMHGLLRGPSSGGQDTTPQAL